MNKKSISVLIAVLSVFVLMFGLVACDTQGGGGNIDNTPKEYVIQYADDSGAHQINVTDGMPYTMPSIPQRTGYTFEGLFDAEVGGTQYVSANGTSVSVFSDKKNMVLFPHFKAKTYSIILDYQEAEVTGGRKFTVEYDAEMPELPKNLVLENKTFVGWYTKPNCEGVKVADAYGVLPKISDINEKNFDLSEGYIYLYAGFEGEKHTVTLFFEDSNGNVDSEEIKVEHGTLVSKIVAKARVNGKAPIAWSKSENGEIFNGKIMGETVLYAREYAPVIDFDSNGGKDVTSLVARAGAGITLPTPQRENYVFDGWYTQSGVAVNYTTMPSDGQTLVAKWKAMIVFDERGGTEVDDISEKVGERVTLPTTSKDGYIFAGWYTEQGEAYTSTSMPSDSVKLVAKYYKVQTKTIVVIDASNAIGGDLLAEVPSVNKNCKEIDLSDIYNNQVKYITLRTHYSVSYRYHYSNGGLDAKSYMSYYNKQQASDAYKVWEYSEVHSVISNEYKTFDREQTIELTSEKLWVCMWRTTATYGYSSGYDDTYWKNFWLEVEYPDTSTLY